MATPRKLKSGSWNVQVYDYTDEQGKRHYASFTADTKDEAAYLAYAYKTERIKKASPDPTTVRQAIEQYIALSEVLSPTTLSSYRKILAYAFPDIMDQPIASLTDETMQRAINQEAKRPSLQSGKRLSPKTVKNEYGLLAAALRNVGLSFNVKLPSVQKKVKEYPAPEVVLQAIKGSYIELPAMLAMWLSFSLSEIRGIQCSSIKGDYIYIDRVMVDVDGESVLKETAKVDTRLRKHRLPVYIKELIAKEDTWKRYKQTGQDGPLIDLTIHQIRDRWQRTCKRNGLHMSFHDLRHMNASIMLALNVPEKYAMERGGWKTPHVMKSVYQHTFSAEREHVDDKIDKYFDEMLNEHAEQSPQDAEN